jgi:predicted enzyme related to lactoylglutathione lyase
MRIRGFAPSTPCWVELTTTNPERAAAFYADVFGWTVDGERFQLNGSAVAGLTASRSDRPDGWLTYLATPDAPATAARIQSAGGRILTRLRERSGAYTVIVADVTGAVFGLWQTAGFPGAQLRGEPGAMAWSDLLSDDVAAATAFYGSVFGWKLSHAFGNGEWLTESHDSVAGLITGRPEPRWQPSFQVADFAAALNECTLTGARVTGGPVDLGLGSYVELVDPFGAAFALTAPVERPVELSLAFNEDKGLDLTYGN